jgi:hypothetical protein
MSILSGDCNRCGLCCTTEVNGHVFVCQYLRAEIDAAYKTKPLGTPGASRCGAYENRRDGMPITLRNFAGDTIHAQCGKNSWAETKTILERGIGRGCSMTVNRAEVPALVELSYDDASLDEHAWLRRHGYAITEPLKLIVQRNDTAFIRTGVA